MGLKGAARSRLPVGSRRLSSPGLHQRLLIPFQGVKSTATMTPEQGGKKRDYDQHRRGDGQVGNNHFQQTYKRYKSDVSTPQGLDEGKGKDLSGGSWGDSTFKSQHPPAQVPDSPPSPLSSSGLPALPPITDPSLAHLPFAHSGFQVSSSERPATKTSPTHNYERLEFLGDAYIELVASHLVMEAFPAYTSVGKICQARQSLVMNSQLARFSRAYGLDERVQVPKSLFVDIRQKKQDKKNRIKEKSWEKVLGDVFEAYVAAVALSAPSKEEGYKIIEQWLLALWKPLLALWKRKGHPYTHDDRGPASSWPDVNDSAKEELGKQIMGQNCKIDYHALEPLDETSMRSSGQAISHMGCYYTGWGWKNELLGKGKGFSRKDAEMRAASAALDRTLTGQIALVKKLHYQRRDEAKAAKDRQGEGAQEEPPCTNGEGVSNIPEAEVQREASEEESTVMIERKPFHEEPEMEVEGTVIGK